MVQKRTVAVVNCGSSSVKLDVFFLPSEDNPLSVLVERVGKPDARLVLKRASAGGEPEHREDRAVEALDPATAVSLVLDAVAAAGFAPDAVGHRVVHGGERFTESVLVDDGVVAAIEACVPLAPLHNPANLAGLAVARARLPNVPHVAVFDTAFHQTLAPEAYLYAVPRALHEQHGVRRYGFHGTSHGYVAERAARFFGRDPSTLNLITLHLGNGCSACAISRGRSIDTSMGMTPLEGLVMGTRCGDLDAAVALRLARERGVDEAERVLNKESGLLGVSRTSQDMRDLERAAAAGDVDADLAIRIFTRRAAKVVGGYAVLLGEVDAVIFTGGIGENSARVRREVCAGLRVLGALLDERRNASDLTGERDLAGSDSRVRILVIPTDEERAIAGETARLARI
ncbi:MAG: acetate kinase [Deltaproteobacteria bacterium]|nr:acetate kinase [Deltaproteobacteria bacterium]